jgi:hypothetical protein
MALSESVLPAEWTLDLQGDRPVTSLRAKEIVLISLSFVFALLLGEIGARIALPNPARADRSAIAAASEMRKPSNRITFRSLHRPDPEAGWILNPGSLEYRNRLVDSHGVLQYDVVYSVESGRRKTSAAPPEGPEVVAAGCSFTFGHGLNDQDTWPWLLQEKLPQHRVVNAGCMGYGTDQALVVAEREVRRHPSQIRAVVFGFGDFQIERNRCTQGWLVTVYPFSKPLFTMRSGDVSYVRQVRFWDGGIAAQYSNLFGQILNTLGNRVNGIPSHEGARNLTAALLTSFGRRFQNLGVRFAVIILPYHGDNSPLARVDRQFIRERLQAASIPVLTIDLSRDEKGALNVRDFMVSSIDHHPNRRYNLALTSQLTPFLHSTGIIEP